MAPPSDASACGVKFRAMLRCVESSGSSAACADKIGDFLACERAVLRAATRHAATNSVSPSPPPSRPSASHSPPPPARAQSAPSPVSLLSRMVAKQSDACVSLVRSATRPHCVRDAQRFASRMLSDLSLSVSAVSARASSTLSNLWRSITGDDSSSKPR